MEPNTRRRTILAITVVSALCTLILPALAGAHRSAVTAETRAMVYDASGRFYGGGSVDEPRSAPPTHTTKEGSRTLQGVPRAVAKDLARGLD